MLYVQASDMPGIVISLFLQHTKKQNSVDDKSNFSSFLNIYICKQRMNRNGAVIQGAEWLVFCIQDNIVSSKVAGILELVLLFFLPYGVSSDQISSFHSLL